jgi:DNA invertase Pin-like site-specific DNA recombinase
MNQPTPTVTVIPAVVRRGEKPDIDGNPTKKRVAAYARVSTDSAEQLSSYEAQVEFYTKHIKENPDWRFVKVYADEGITATNTKKREGFNDMVEDALCGKIDLIITKSVSRFARNTVDTIATVRLLKAKGVEIYFEKENIRSFDGKSELVLTIMASLAQEESRSISENVTWGKRKRMADGKFNLPYKRFLGYEKGDDGNPKIVEREAEIVRLIYGWFLEGRGYRDIAERLTGQNIPTPGGKTLWSVSTVRSILTNEKYAGNALLQKKFTVDFLTKKQKANEGEVPQYYVENSHPAIVSPETFELVQGEIRRRQGCGKALSGKGLFFGKIICGQCGGFYGSKVWHSTDRYRRRVWLCNRKYRKGTRCATPHLGEDAVKTAFVRAYAALVANKERYMAQYMLQAEKLANSASFDEETARLRMECAEASAMAEDCIRQNAKSSEDQDRCKRRYDELTARYDLAKTKLEEATKAKLSESATKAKLTRFVEILRQSDEAPKTFDEHLWNAAAESVTVYAKDDVVVTFRSGTKIRVGAE